MSAPQPYVAPGERCAGCGKRTRRAGGYCVGCDPTRRAFALDLYRRRAAGEPSWRIGYAFHLSKEAINRWCRIGAIYAKEEETNANH